MAKAFLVGKTCLDLNKLHPLIKQVLGTDVDLSGNKNTDRSIFRSINNNETQINKTIHLSICTVLDEDSYLEVVDQGILQILRTPQTIKKFYYFCLFTASKYDWLNFIKTNKNSLNEEISSFSLEVEDLIRNV